MTREEARKTSKLDRKRWGTCEMRMAEDDAKNWQDGGAHDFRVAGDSLYYFDPQFGWEGIEIRFCPACGRPLTKEAWADLEWKIGVDNDA